MDAPLDALRRLVAKTGVGLGGLGEAERCLALGVPARAIAAGVDHAEAQVNAALKASLAAEAAFLATDHVELRRWLVDTGFWTRDGYGRAYRRPPDGELPPRLQPVAAALAALDLPAWVAAERAQQAEARARRRAAWAGRDGEPG